ncbi:acetylcholinesterase [Rhizodiscina lignyota]|uniref:Carboxylic ester hydrolase n=1 Tax=Rhizodiscina lignyota TaxID=1504668 RepID=A0A9P4M405_9PEZI|nr:acetylcholinesterase [Rhizodiscina lignyota]
MKSACYLLFGTLLYYLTIVEAGRLPQVDLGYEIHEATTYNATTQLYAFNNIRYAQPPIGDLRFSAPVPPTGRNTTVQKSTGDRICPPAQEDWGCAGYLFGRDFEYGNTSEYNYTYATEECKPVNDLGAEILLNHTGISEDCLFLDVVVPRAVFDQRNSSGSGAPVFVWIHGGGYVFGYKNDPNDSGDPSALIKASQSDYSDGMIFVAINYRLGAFGWLAGPSLDAANGTANAGLHDQRLALEWVQENIHRFGGDPKQVTIGGLSAGGGSTVHQITAYGGQKPVPFARAFSNSAGYFPIDSHYVTENTTQTFLARLNVSTIDEARKLPSSDLITANMDHVRSATFGFVYGPVVDGSFVPALPGNSLLAGHFDHNLDVLVSHVTHEGGEYNAPWVQNDADFRTLLKLLQPGMLDPVIEYITKMFPGVGPLRTIPFLGDYVFTCNTNWLARAFGNKTYNWEFAITPAYHAYDLGYIFPGSYSAPVIEPLAKIMRGYIANFVKTGNPNGKGLPSFPQQGNNASHNVFTKDGVVTERDSTVGRRCEWMQEGLWV